MMRVGPQAVTLSCQNCQHTYPAQLTNIVDAEAAPELKARLLAGDLNVSHCPRCQANNPIIVPLLYHDATKDLCVTHVPPQLNLSADQQEKIVGELLNGLITSLPGESVRGYLFQPRSSLTMQNLREQILTAEGYSSEEIETQRTMGELLQNLLSASAATLDDAIHQHDAHIDERFLTTITLLHEQMRRDGQADAEADIQRLMERLLEVSTAGQHMRQQRDRQLAALQAIQTDVSALGEKPSRQSIRQLALCYIEQEDIYLETLVSALRPALDYAFYQELTAALHGASPTEKEQLTTLREKLLEISARVDQLQQLALEQADVLIAEMLSASELTEALQQYLPYIDQHFFRALGARLGEAERAGNAVKTEALRSLQETVLAAIQKVMRPELILLNELLEIKDLEVALRKLSAVGAPLRDELLVLIAELQPILEERGDTMRLERLEALRAAAETLPQLS